MVSNGSPPPLPTDLKKAFDAKQFNKTNMGPCHVSMHANLPRKRIDKAPILLYKFSSLKLEAARNKKDKVRLRLFFPEKFVIMSFITEQYTFVWVCCCSWTEVMSEVSLSVGLLQYNFYIKNVFLKKNFKVTKSNCMIERSGGWGEFVVYEGY